MEAGHGNSRLTTGARVLAEMLEGYGVTHLFHVPAILRRTMVEIEEHTSIKRVRPHGEKPAAYMADGFARASGRPGVCAAQAVGALNLAAGLRDAHLAHSPVIAFTGGRDPHTRFHKAYQEVDDLPAFSSVTKMNVTVDAVERIPDMIRQAFREATSGAPGPVHIQFAGNEGQVDAQEADMEIRCEQQFAIVPPSRPAAVDADLVRALELLAAAERPVFVAGSGVRASGAGPALVQLAERMGIPVATSHNGKDIIAGTHPLSVGVVGTYSRGSANRVVLEADLVCFAGTETGGMTTHSWKVPAVGTPAIQIDIEAEALGRNYPLQMAINADAGTALSRMLELVEGAAGHEDWRAVAARHVMDWRTEYASLLESDQVPIRPERLCAELTNLVPDDGVVVVDTGHAGMWMGGMFDLRQPTQSYLRSAGHLGWAFPSSLGAKCALPDRPVVCFTGDSGLWYHIAEIETAVRWGINTVTVVNNNHSGNQSKRGFDAVYGGTQSAQAREMWVFTEVDFSRLATDIGAVGIRVEKPAEFAPAFDRALSADRPVVIDVVTDIDALAPLPVE